MKRNAAEKQILTCPSCGSTLKLTISVTVHDEDPDHSQILFHCAGKCKTQYEQERGIRLGSGIPMYSITPGLQGMTGTEKHLYLLDMARQYVSDDSSIMAHRQQILASCGGA